MGLPACFLETVSSHSFLEFQVILNLRISEDIVQIYFPPEVHWEFQIIALALLEMRGGQVARPAFRQLAASKLANIGAKWDKALHQTWPTFLPLRLSKFQAPPESSAFLCQKSLESPRCSQVSVMMWIGFQTLIFLSLLSCSKNYHIG